MASRGSRRPRRWPQPDSWAWAGSTPRGPPARPLPWELRDAQGRPTAAASCFAVGAGTLAPAAGAGRVSLSVPRVSEGACAGASFTLVVAPEGRMGHALYTESLPFTLR